VLGSLYIVDGVDFECLMELCNITISKNAINITLSEEVKSSSCHNLMIKSECIKNLQQVWPTAFQLLINDPQGKLN
jgi:hypothetical protein